MKTARRLAYILLSFLLLSIVYFFVRPYFRLPFDSVPVYAAIEESSELLIKLPTESLFTSDSSRNYLWKQDARQLLNMLDSLGLKEAVNWEEWWLLPQSGENNKTLTFTFIGSSPELGKKWSPQDYGPSLPYGGGQIYTYAITTNKPVYFARYHNLLIVGQYPFQIERALLAAQKGMTSWADNEQLADLIPLPEEEGWQCLLRKESSDHAVFRKLLGHTSLSKQPLDWDWAYLGIKQTDSSAYAKAILKGVPAMHPNVTATAWGSLPPNTASAFPIKTINMAASLSDLSVGKWLGEGAWTLQLTQPASDAKVDPRLWILPIGDSIAYRKFNNLRQHDLSVIDRANYQLFDLEQWQDAGPFDVLSDRKLWQPWSCELQGALILSVYRDDLEKYLDYHLLGATIAETSAFLQLQKDLKPLAHADWQAYQYWQSAAAYNNIFQFLFPDAAWATHGVLLGQAKKQPNQTILLEAIVQQAPDRKGTLIDWSTTLPTAEKLRLLRVNNEQDQPVALLVQNTNGQIWTFDLAGRELWKQQLPDILFDPIRAVSYSSGVQRWVGATDSDVYIWDNNGIDQAKHTLKGVLPTAAPAHLTFPSVDESLLAFPTENNALELFYMNGNSPKGWPVKTEDKVASSLLYIGQDREDLMIAYTERDDWLVVNRQGVMMDSFSVADTTGIKVGELYLSSTKASTEPDCLVRGQSDGSLSINSLSGEYTKLQMGRGPVDNLVQIDCWGDKRPDYLVQRGRLLHLFAYEGNEFSERWQYRLPVSPDRIVAAPPLGVLAISDGRKKVWLINGEGELQDGFPVAGEENAFLAGSVDDGFRLITTLDRKLYAYFILY